MIVYIKYRGGSFLYIKGIKELLLELNELKVFMEEFRTKILEVNSLVYPTLIDKFGAESIDQELLLETLFLTIAQTDFKYENKLVIVLGELELEPIFLNEEDALANPYIHFYFKDKLWCVDVNAHSVWKTMYGNEIKISEMSNKHLENSIMNIQNSISEMQKVDKDVVKFNKTNNHSEKVLLSQMRWLAVLNYELSQRSQIAV